jgi:ATP-dependent protease ClpP protease subunit
MNYRLTPISNRDPSLTPSKQKLPTEPPMEPKCEEEQKKTKVEKIIEYEQKFNLTNYQYPFNMFSEVDRTLAERIKTHIDKAIVDKTKLEMFQKENPKDEFLQALKFPNLKFVMSTYGGSVTDSITICNAFDFAKKKGFVIEILATGTIMSAGVPIFSSGSLGFRYTEPGVFFLIHNISIFTYGSFPEIRNQVKYYDEMDRIYFNIIIKNTKMSRKELRDILDSNLDYYYTSEEALEQGLADEIL